MSGPADVVTLARAHLQRFAAHQGSRPDDRGGAPWPLAIESARLLGLATRELAELRRHCRQLEASIAAIEARRRTRSRAQVPSTVLDLGIPET